MFRFGVVIAFLVVAINAQQTVVVPATGAVFFTSENYPGMYPNNHLATWNVVGPEGASLEFNAIFFQLENSCSYDWVEIMDNGESLGKQCGSDGPAGARTTGNTATVTFKTDSSVNGGGFNITVRVAKCAKGVSACPNAEDVCIASNQWCDGHPDCPEGIDEQCPDLSDCGRSTIPPIMSRKGHKIVGGIEAEKHSWPWQVAMLTTGNFQFCGGSIISDRWIMSAAHCCQRTAASMKVRVGSHVLTNWVVEGAVDHEIEKIVNHPEYSTRPATNRDFCLLKTKTKIQFNSKVAQVCLPKVADPLENPGTECHITGWGTTSSGGSASSKLLQTSVSITEPYTCKAAYGGDMITDQMICAAQPGRDTCQGDSGGPLVCPAADGRWQLVGVTSWGRGCAMAGYPGVYARTSTALEWITTTMVKG